jgi:MFS family permease
MVEGREVISARGVVAANPPDAARDAVPAPEAAPTPPESPARDSSRPGLRRFIGLNVSHLLADLYGILPSTVISELARQVGHSYASVSALVGLGGMASGLANILLGLGSDRWPVRRRSVVLWAAAVTVLATSSIGLIRSYPLLMLAMMAGAFACGAFHPPGFALGGEVSAERRHRNLSILMTAGVAGGSLGPLIVGWLVARSGMQAVSLFALPGLGLLVVAAVLLYSGERDTVALPVTHTDPSGPADAAARIQIFLLFTNSTLRAFAHMSVVVIISALMAGAWGLSALGSGLALGALQVGSGLGGLLCAMATPHRRERWMTLLCVPFAVAALAPMALTGGWIWCLWLFIFGFFVNGPAAIVVALAQHAVPRRRAVVSGMMVGVSYAVGGPVAALTSPWLLEHVGQELAVAFIAVPLVLAFIAAMGLSKPRKEL